MSVFGVRRKSAHDWQTAGYDTFDPMYGLAVRRKHAHDPTRTDDSHVGGQHKTQLPRLRNLGLNVSQDKQSSNVRAVR